MGGVGRCRRGPGRLDRHAAGRGGELCVDGRWVPPVELAGALARKPIAPLRVLRLLSSQAGQGGLPNLLRDEMARLGRPVIIVATRHFLAYSRNSGIVVSVTIATDASGGLLATGFGRFAAFDGGLCLNDAATT